MPGAGPKLSDSRRTEWIVIANAVILDGRQVWRPSIGTVPAPVVVHPFRKNRELKGAALKARDGTLAGRIILLVSIAFSACLLTAAQGQDSEATKSKASPKPLAQDEQERLLKTRVDGRTGGTFRQFSSQFLATSRLSLTSEVRLMTSSDEIAGTSLQPVYPPTYKPTLRELLDVVTLQTRSQWKYDPTSKSVPSDVETGPVTEVATFEFTKTGTERTKPYQVTLPKGWRSVDRGHWTMYVPPNFPLGMDIYELGAYSSDDKTEADDLVKRIPRDVALGWAKRAKDNVDPKEFTPAKVGPYPALYFDTMKHLRDGSTVRWRQWVFMVDNQCYGVVSTIFPLYEDKFFPDVQSMLASFVIKKPK